MINIFTILNEHRHFWRQIFKLSKTELIKQYKNLVVIPILSNMENDIEHFDSYNIEEICKSCIPDHLTHKFKLISDTIKIQK